MKSKSAAPFSPCPENLEQLEDLLSLPTPGTIHTLSQLPGDLLILGVGGKMGPSLARMARRACPDPDRRIIGVSRFSSVHLEEQLQAWGIQTVRCNLLEKSDLAKLPDAPNLIYMVGRKFGSSGQEFSDLGHQYHSPGRALRPIPPQPNRRLLHRQRLPTTPDPLRRSHRIRPAQSGRRIWHERLGPRTCL